MSATPDFRYARSGEISIAYARWGEGERVVIYTPPLVSNVELAWELPEIERSLTWAGRHHQSIMIDKRGVGLSDRITGISTLEDYSADVLAVLDAENVQSADLLGVSEGGAIAMQVAADHPERVRSLTIVGTAAYGATRQEVMRFADETHQPKTNEELHEFSVSLVKGWGRPGSQFLKLFAPSAADNPRIGQFFDRFARQSCSSGALLNMFRSMARFDIRPLAARIQAPTLICHHVDDEVVHVVEGRALADMIPGARLIEWPGADHIWQLSPDWRRNQNDIIEFITGARPGTGSQKRFATVLFTDIVGSTARAAELGDAGWWALMQLHDGVCRARVTTGGGEVVKSTGDGMLATFTDPASAVDAALDLSRDLAASGLPIRAGLHIGQIEVMDEGDVSGIAVNIASRVMDRAGEGETLVSQTLRDMLMGGEIVMEDRGAHALKGVDGEWRLFKASHPEL